MTELHLQHPLILGALLVVIPIVLLGAWKSRAMSGAGWIFTLVVRLAWAIGCILALAGPALVHEKVVTGPARIVVLQDMSGSVSSAAADAEILRQTLMAALPGSAKVTTLDFAGGVWNPGESPVEIQRTDIEGALNAANAQSLEEDAAVILLSDGRATQGDSLAAANRLALRGAVVHTIPIGRHETHAPQIVRIDPPVDGRVGIASGMRVTVTADEAVSANVRLLRPGGAVVDQRTIPLQGPETVILHFTPEAQGVQLYTVDVQVGAPPARPGMHMAPVRTDSKVIPLYAEGPPRILIADPFPSEVTALAQTLAPLKVPVDVISPDCWPDDLTPYAAIVASDWSGKELTAAQRIALRRYVEELGGGLVFIGGGNVLPAHWKGHELAAVLPVVLHETPVDLLKQNPPDVAVCFVLDRSGSMGEGLATNGGNAVSKLELVKVAVQASVASLPEQACVAVVVFDSTTEVVVPPTPLTQRADVARQIDSIGLGGGTTMTPAVQKGLELLAGMKGDRFLVVLTDGICEDHVATSPGWSALTTGAKRIHASWTSIAVGADADQNLLQALAQEMHGSFFFCDTGDKIPQVFLQHAQAIRRLVERKDRPIHAQAGPAVDWLKDVAVTQMPTLSGRVRATAKQQVDTILLSETTDPLLASWHFGLGRVTAFTSDAKAGWANDWLAWKGYGPFWLQVVQSGMRSNPLLNVKVMRRMNGSKVVFEYHVLNQTGQPATDLQYQGQVTSIPGAAPGGKVPAITWQQRGGEYRATLDVSAGTEQYLVAMELKPAIGAGVHYCALVSSGPSVEMAQTGPDLASLRAIAEAGQGACAADPAAIGQLCSQSMERRELTCTNIWPWLIILCLLLWPVDVALRKIF